MTIPLNRISKGIYEFHGLILRRITTIAEADKFRSLVVVATDGSVAGVVGNDYVSLRNRLVSFPAMSDFLLSYGMHEVSNSLYMDWVSSYRQPLAVGGKHTESLTQSVELVRDPCLVVPVLDNAACVGVADVFCIMSTAVSGRLRFLGHVPVYNTLSALELIKHVKPKSWNPNFANICDDQANFVFPLCTGHSIASFVDLWKSKAEHADQAEVIEVMNATVSKALPQFRVDVQTTPVNVPVHVAVGAWNNYKPEIVPYLAGWMDEHPSQRYYASADQEINTISDKNMTNVRIPSFGTTVLTPHGDSVLVGRFNQAMFINTTGSSGGDVCPSAQYRRPGSSAEVVTTYDRPVDTPGVWVEAETQYFRPCASLDLGSFVGKWAVVPGSSRPVTGSSGEMTALSVFGPCLSDVWVDPECKFDVSSTLQAYSEQMNGTGQAVCTQMTGVVENGAQVPADVIAGEAQSSASSGMLYTTNRLSVDTNCVTPLTVCNVLAINFDRDASEFELGTVANYLLRA